MNRRQSKRNEEKAVFEAFLDLRPDFAGEPIERWQLAESDPPDVVCWSRSGKTIGVELVEWLHEGEMSAGKKRESAEQHILDAIGEQPLNTSKYFKLVILHPRGCAQNIGRGEKAPFRAALIDLVADVDRRWPDEPSWHYARGCRIKDLKGWPPLDKYLNMVHFVPGERDYGEAFNWIVTPGHVDTFDDATMVKPLPKVLSKKIAKYRARPMSTCCDDLGLLVYFSQGVKYNSPFATPRRPLEKLVGDVCLALPQDHRVFRFGYLYLAIRPEERVFRLW
jgi:hypothetical protein